MKQTIKKRMGTFQTKCYRKVLKIPWTAKKKYIDILRELNIQEDWLIISVLLRKLKYFGHIKRHDGLERTVMESMVPGKRERGRPRRRWTQDIKETMNMELKEAGDLARDR
mgnify:CR=1 FL=1